MLDFVSFFSTSVEKPLVRMVNHVRVLLPACSRHQCCFLSAFVERKQLWCQHLFDSMFLVIDTQTQAPGIYYENICHLGCFFILLKLYSFWGGSVVEWVRVHVVCPRGLQFESRPRKNHFLLGHLPICDHRLWSSMDFLAPLKTWSSFIEQLKRSGSWSKSW